MRFRRTARTPEPRQLQPRVSRPRNRPETEIPGLVPVDRLLFERSEQAVMAITGISAYTSGFEFALTRLIRPGAPGWDGGVVQPAPDGWRGTDRAAEISLRLSDGTIVSSDRPHDDPPPAGPILRFSGGGGTANRQVLRFWAWPLPPPGPLEFICRWPTFGITETGVSIDAQLILDAARRSIRIWPEDTQPAD